MTPHAYVLLYDCGYSKYFIRFVLKLSCLSLNKRKMKEIDFQVEQLMQSFFSFLVLIVSKGGHETLKVRAKILVSSPGEIIMTEIQCSIYNLK